MSKYESLIFSKIVLILLFVNVGFIQCTVNGDISILTKLLLELFTLRQCHIEPSDNVVNTVLN